MKKIILLVTMMFVASNTVSHPGRTNSAGCHTNRKTGEYHCHGKAGSSSMGKSKRKTSKKSTTNKKSVTTKSGNSRTKGLGTGVSGELYFKDCNEAKKMGYSNIQKGQPGYRKGLDPDGNGIACEK